MDIMDMSLCLTGHHVNCSQLVTPLSCNVSQYSSPGHYCHGFPPSSLVTLIRSSTRKHNSLKTPPGLIAVNAVHPLTILSVFQSEHTMLASHRRGKIPKVVCLKGRKFFLFSFWLLFQRFLSMVTCLHCFGACHEAELYGRKHTVEQVCSPYGNWKAKRGRDQGPDIPFKGTSPGTQFPSMRTPLPKGNTLSMSSQSGDHDFNS